MVNSHTTVVNHLQITTYTHTSLVPRPSHHPLFEYSIQNGGERPGPFHHKSDVSIYLGRQKRGGRVAPDQTNELEAFLM